MASKTSPPKVMRRSPSSGPNTGVVSRAVAAREAAERRALAKQKAFEEAQKAALEGLDQKKSFTDMLKAARFAQVRVLHPGCTQAKHASYSIHS